MRARLRWALGRQADRDQELHEEIVSTLEMLTDEYVAAGLDPGEARRRAHHALGGVEQVEEQVRDARPRRWLGDLGRDLRYGLRGLKNRPGLTIAVVFTLSLGIGANTAIFTLMDAVMWRMLPVNEPESLWVLEDGMTYAGFEAVGEGDQVLRGIAAYAPSQLNVSIDGSIEPTAAGQLVTGGYFPLLGVGAAAGRAIGPEDDRVSGVNTVAMISHGYWTRRFGRERSVVGRVIQISGHPFTIIGVTPRDFFGTEVGTAPDIFVPLTTQPVVMAARENLIDDPIIQSQWLRVLIRLRSNVDPEGAIEVMQPLWQRTVPIPADGLATAKGRAFAALRERPLTLTPAATGVSELRAQFSQPLTVLMGVVGILLLIACANTANLFLASAAARRREFAMRLALGAGRWRLARQLLIEGVLLASIGGVLGIMLAYGATGFLVTLMSAVRADVTLDLTPNLSVLFFTASVSILAGILFGTAPAIRGTRIDLTRALRGLSAPGRSGGAARPDKTLVVVQVALSLVLFAGATLFVRSLQNVDGRASSESRENVLMMRVEPEGSDQRNIPGTEERLDRIYRELIVDVKSVPGVLAASMAQFTPTVRRGLNGSVVWPDRERVRFFGPMVYPGYFRTMRIPIVSGRVFQDSEPLGPEAPRLAVVNRSYQRRVFPGQEAVGQPCGGTGSGWITNNGCEIIGVVEDSQYSDLRGGVEPTVYFPFLQAPTGRGQMVLHVRIDGPIGPVVQRVRQLVSRIDPTLPLFEVRSLAEEIEAVLIRERLIALLAAVFGGLALVMSCIGLYGLLAFTMVRRTGELGLRLAVGARRATILGMVAKEAMLLVFGGVVLGVVVAIALARVAGHYLDGLLFGVEALDLGSIGVAVLALTAVGAMAALIPGWRASRLDPATALRAE